MARGSRVKALLAPIKHLLKIWQSLSASFPWHFCHFLPFSNFHIYQMKSIVFLCNFLHLSEKRKNRNENAWKCILFMYIFSFLHFTRKTIVKMFWKKWTRFDAIFYTYLFEIVIIFCSFSIIPVCWKFFSEQSISPFFIHFPTIF